jgi:thioredoxin 1
MNIIKNAKEYDDVLSSNKSVFVDFYADWCGPCKMVSPIVEKLAEENTGIVFIKVNVDENPDIAQRYGIMSIPTLIAMKDGKPVQTSVGFKPKEELEDMIASIR